MDALDPVAYLRATPPFDALPEALFEAAARALEVGFYPGGTWLVRAGGTPLDRLFVIRTGAVRLERNGQPVQVLEEGEIFGYTSLITRQATLDVLVEENLLAYELPGAEFERLRDADAGFSSHFAVELGARLKSSLARSPLLRFRANLSRELGALVRRAPVSVEGDATVEQAARLMRSEGVSSVLVRGDALGIVTDRDLSSRVLADGLGPETLVSAVASRPLRTLPAETPVHEAWGSLLESGAHHVPVTRGGELLGVLSANDLLEACAPGPMAVLREVERLASRDALPGYAARVAEMDSALLAGGLDATAVGELVSRLDDALRARVIFLAQSDLGPAPAPFAWLAFGAEARREQTLLTERDDGLAFADRGLERDAYYYALAERVDQDLEAAGFPRRPRGVRRPFASLGEWTMRVDACIDERRPHEAAFLFDLRKVWGTLDVAPLEIAVGRAQKNPAFLRHLARAAIDHRPPGSLGLRLRGDASVDLDAQGISLVVSLARCYGLEVGAQARGTLERLEAAAEAGLISDDAHESVAEAYRFLQGLKLRQGLRMISEGRPPASTVRLKELSAIERSRLKDAFRAIARWQERAAYHYRTDFF